MSTQFDFLGYTFRARTVKNSKRNSLFVSLTPAISGKAAAAMRQKTRKLNYRNRTDLSLANIARLHNPLLRGWREYDGKFCRSAMYPVLRHFNKTLVAWAMRKYSRLKGHKIRASRFLKGAAGKHPYLFVHWQRGRVAARLLDGSGVNRAVHAPFCERPGVQFPRSTRHACFNTLKNQGYHLEHNYGHGENHLAFNFYPLTHPITHKFRTIGETTH